MRDVEDVARDFAAACRAAGVSYVFVGGMAVMAWGEPRATRDVHAMLRITPEGLDAFAKALAARGLRAKAEDMADSLSDGSHATILADESAFHIDAKFARKAFEFAEIDEAVDVDMGGWSLRVASPEQTIAFKLLFGSRQDILDARGILVRQGGRVDRRHLAALAAKLDVSRALDPLLRQIGERRES